MNSIFLLIFLAGFTITLAEKVRYDNHRVMKVEIENDSQLELLQSLEKFHYGILFIHPPMNTPQTIDIVVSPHIVADIDELFESNQIKHEVKVHNLQELIDEEQQQNLVKSDSFGWEKYNDLEEIYTWLDELLEKHSDVLTNLNYGTSYENRTLRAVKLSHKTGNPTIFIEANMHAREWVTSATATYILNELLTSSDEEIRSLAENYDWIFVVVANVDGFVYSHTKDRMWRKTRQPNPDNKRCIGTDPNRNFDFHHAESGASTDPCSETYAGPKPNSEPEVQALTEFIQTFRNLKLYISFHSFSQLLMFPYGYSTTHVPNHNELLQISKKAKEAIAIRYKTRYTVGSIAETIYKASGSSIDWTYAKHNVSLSYAFEFRDTGRYGFILPPDQIIPNSLEIIDGLIAMIKEAKELKYF